MSKIPKPPSVQSVRFQTTTTTTTSTTINYKNKKKQFLTKESRNEESETKRKSVERVFANGTLDVKNGENRNPPIRSRERTLSNQPSVVETKQKRSAVMFVDPPSKLPLTIWQWRRQR